MYSLFSSKVDLRFDYNFEIRNYSDKLDDIVRFEELKLIYLIMCTILSLQRTMKRQN